MKRVRLDELLLQRGLAESRAQAQALILAGRVSHGTARLEKPGKAVPENLEVTLAQPPRFVSRGGEKLVAALAHFALDLQGSQVLDVGASTGGFTDCVLQAGAAAVTCVDVGRAQLHARLRADPRVTNLEQVNARHLRPSDLPRPDYDAIVMDLSFISLTAVLPAVIRDPAVQDAALARVRTAAAQLLWVEDRGAIDSPLRGADGNREFLLCLRRRTS
jgi:23S rRNA (cytidine1920-2'-O)/16S rRNA (cytidine1409-2'-O)-methyltransferase